MKLPTTNYKLRTDSGQTLITLLFFIIVALTISSAATIIILVNSLASTKFQEGTNTYYVAESGAENAVLRLLRNPSYTGETLIVGEGTATVTVTGSEPKTITSTGRIGNFTRTVQVVIGYTNNILTIFTWKEIF